MIQDLPERYQPIGQTENGGFGAVTFCNDIHLDRRVAIKFLHDRSQQRRIFDEVKALLQMRSKHVVQVYDVVVSPNGEFGIVQEYIDGEDLSEPNGKWRTTDDYLKIIWQIATGIADIHSAGLIHRDIKPMNMKICKEGILKIFDFGLAREEGPRAHTVGFVGTRGFAAPELYEGGQFTKAIDIYAFGVTAIFIALGELHGQLQNPREAGLGCNLLHGHHLNLPVEVVDTLWRCIAPNAQDRPEISEVRDLLASYLLRNKHQALAVYNGTASYLNIIDPIVELNFTNVGKIQIQYDGLSFSVTQASGEIFINNRQAVVGQKIPNSCVVALGSAVRRGDRRYITFDVSNPEVVV